MFKLITAPTGEPVTLEEVKSHLRITNEDEDDYISALIVTARKSIERYLNRALMTQTYDYYLENWKDVIRLPFPPLVSVTSVTYNGNLTLSTSVYDVVNYDDPGYIKRKYETSWPTLDVRPDAVVIRYVCGYGDAQDVPEDIRHAILLTCGDLYAHRETILTDTRVFILRKYLTDLIHSYKIYV
jgi:uncharacterized phiE125 gp8 family phage protein